MTLQEKLAALLADRPTLRDIRIMAKTALLAGDYELAAALRATHDEMNYRSSVP